MGIKIQWVGKFSVLLELDLDEKRVFAPPYYPLHFIHNLAGSLTSNLRSVTHIFECAEHVDGERGI